jgi:hypothetical protein
MSVWGLSVDLPEPQALRPIPLQPGSFSLAHMHHVYGLGSTWAVCSLQTITPNCMPASPLKALCFWEHRALVHQGLLMLGPACLEGGRLLYPATPVQCQSVADFSGSQPLQLSIHISPVRSEPVQGSPFLDTIGPLKTSLMSVKYNLLRVNKFCITIFLWNHYASFTFLNKFSLLHSPHTDDPLAGVRFSMGSLT